MARFDDCLAFTLKAEGGFVNNPADPGGATNQGVTQKVYDAFRVKQGLPQQSVKFIVPAEVSAIYMSQYWAPSHCDALRMPLDLVMFDTAVNSGVSGAVKLLQQAAGATVDGVCGPMTLMAANKPDPTTMAAQLIDQREQRYKDIVAANPSQAIFLKGWVNRCNDLRAACGIPLE